MQIVPKGGSPRELNLDLNDIEDFTNLFFLRKEVFQMHTDFLQQGFGLKPE